MPRWRASGHAAALSGYGDTGRMPIERSPAGRLEPDRRLSPEHVALGRAIRELRVAGDLSQEGLAERCALHRTYVGGIERGERNVSFGNLVRLARALEVPLSALLARAERADPATAGARRAAAPS